MHTFTQEGGWCKGGSRNVDRGGPLNEHEKCNMSKLPSFKFSKFQISKFSSFTVSKITKLSVVFPEIDPISKIFDMFCKTDLHDSSGPIFPKKHVVGVRNLDISKNIISPKKVPRLFFEFFEVSRCLKK